MRKVLIAIGILVCVCVIAGLVIWFYPVVRSIPTNHFSIQEYVRNGKSALLCKFEANTGPGWKIYKFGGVDNTPDYIYIAGNTPDNTLKFPEYIYYNSTFLFIGTFAQNTEIFNVEEWYFVGDIERVHLILPYPKYGLNFWEIE